MADDRELRELREALARALHERDAFERRLDRLLGLLADKMIERGVPDDVLGRILRDAAGRDEEEGG